MNKILVMLALCFLVLGFMFQAPIVLAQDNTSNSGSGSVDDLESDSANVVSDEDDSTAVRVDDEREDEDEDRSGKRPRDILKERIKERDGVLVREVDRRFVDENGNEVRIQRRIKFKDGQFEVKTRLRVEGEGANFSVEDSEGRKHRVRVTPDRLRALARDRLRADNVTNFSLEEIRHKNVPRVVYKVNSEHPGRFLGILKMRLRAETHVDPETGEVLDFKRPWWAFLVAEDLPADSEVVGNEEIAAEVIADDAELEEALGDVEEVDDEVEAETEEEEESEEIVNATT